MIGSKNAAEGWASFAAALAAHGALALGIAASPGVPGAGGRQTTAISLNLIDTAIIEAALEPRASQAEARHRDVDEHAGKRENSQPAPAQRERREEITAAIGARPQLTRPEQRARPEAYRPSKASRKGGAKGRAASPPPIDPARQLRRARARSTAMRAACAPGSRGTIQGGCAHAARRWSGSGFRGRARYVTCAL